MLAILDVVIYSLVLVALVIASWNDIKTREVPDWLNYSLIAAGLGIRTIFSIVHASPTYILEGILGFAVFLALSLLLFYTGMWGGGDSKLLMGLGALIGISYTNFFESFMLVFFILLLFTGSLYGFAWSLVLALKNKRAFVRKFKDIFHHERMLIVRRVLVIFLVVSIIFYLFTFQNSSIYLNLSYIFLLVLIFLIFFLWIFSKAVEESCMYKWVAPEELTEGDWIVKDIVIGKKRICGPKDLGIEQSQIDELIKLKKKRKIKEILIKEGIPFVPTFLIAFVLALLVKDKIIIILLGLF